MADTIPKRNRWKFGVQWVGLNLLGCVIGVCLLIGLGIITYPYYEDFIILASVAYVVILGIRIGIFQGLTLRKFGINLFAWTSMTVLGYGIGVATSILLILLLSRYSEINPDAEIIFGVGFAIIGIPQSAIIRKYLSRSPLWWTGLS